MKRAMSGSDSCEDALVDDVYAYVTQNSYPIGCSGTRKRQIRKRAERFSVKEGHLYYTSLRVAQVCHVDVTSGHVGVAKTVARIKERFMWKGFLSDVKSMVSIYLLFC